MPKKSLSKLFNKMAGRLPANPLIASQVADKQMGNGIDMKSALIKAATFSPKTMSRSLPSPQKMGALAKELTALESKMYS